ncbi:hypothetical protein VSH64_42640 [Amycolatopsis rhabdoformis]|uniref:Uncharacterized protein n=1 Tax=Amycolatopsis rhabdoformis TaxID=1448059 RepID=A0ABZ1I6E3_9PSEU|nr:hypothetical protein [Amycolatopsis rhabdoformis]WSE29433.1 hypothetical protein VSH64_42640 [Amycolatopsis rhabdoformis]
MGGQNDRMSVPVRMFAAMCTPKTEKFMRQEFRRSIVEDFLEPRAPARTGQPE